MRCNQTNKKFKVDITLSKDDGTPLSQEDMNEGSQLLMEYKKKSWSVTVTSVILNPPVQQIRKIIVTEWTKA